MSGLRVFLAKDLREIVRTWRLWVLPGFLLFSALTGPPTARFIRELLATVGGDAFQGLVPDPTWADSYAQWAKNLTQVVTLALVISLGGTISGEKRNGTAALVLTKPVSRGAFVWAKFLSTTTLVVTATLLGMLLTWLFTMALFPAAPLGPVLAATAAWLLFAALLVAVTLLASAALDSAAGAAGVGLGAYFLLLLLGVWGPALKWSPAGLAAAPSALAVDAARDLLWPALTTAVLTAALMWAAVAVFQRREL